MYQDISDWRVRHTEHDEEHPVVAVKASALHDFLIKRYNMEGTLPFEVPIHLPKSKENINLCCHDATAQLIDTLTDPHESLLTIICFGMVTQSRLRLKSLCILMTSTLAEP